jgi:hypothetical protein
MNLEFVKSAVRSLYDAQKLRIEVSNRISKQEKVKVLSEEWEVKARRHVLALRNVEKELLKDVRTVLRETDIWPWLDGVKGVGPAMAGVLVAGVQDPARFETVSKLWAYCGLHVIDGRAPRRKKGERANWDSFMRTKLLGVLGGSFLKCNSPYRSFYDNYKVRLENRPCSMSAAQHKKGAEAEDLLPNGCTKGHMHNKANRYMVKMFLVDFWTEWRTLRGLPVRSSYQEEYLGHKHTS